MNYEDILQRFKVERSVVSATRNGMFGGPVDETERFVPGILQFTIDGAAVPMEEFYEKLVAAMAELIAELTAPKEPPLLQCVSCKNTESPAGAMARQFNHGHCMYCGGYFKVVRA